MPFRKISDSYGVPQHVGGSKWLRTHFKYESQLPARKYIFELSFELRFHVSPRAHRAYTAAREGPDSSGVRLQRYRAPTGYCGATYRRNSSSQPLVDPEILHESWKKFPHFF